MLLGGVLFRSDIYVEWYVCVFSVVEICGDHGSVYVFIA